MSPQTKHIVIGATGLIGSHLLLKLLSEGIHCVAGFKSEHSKDTVKKLFHNFKSDSLFELIQWEEIDVCDLYLLENIISCDSIVYNCSGIVSFSQRDEEKLEQINIIGVRNIVNVCLSKRVKKLIHLSSVAALGGDDKREINETNTIKNATQLGVYANSKYLGELEVWRGIEEGLMAVILNPSVVVGEGDENKSSSMLFKFTKGTFGLYTKGATGYVDVKDVVNAIIAISNSDISGERYILNGVNLKYEEAFTLIRKQYNLYRLTEVPPFVIKMVANTSAFFSFIGLTKDFLPKSATESALNKKSYSSKKFQNVFNYNFIPFDESVKRIAQFYLS